MGERKSPLSGLFFVLTIAAYVAYVRRPFSLARYLAVAALFTLGLLAKPTLVILPFLLLLLDYWPLGRVDGGRWTVDGGRWTVDGEEPNPLPSTVHRPPSTSLVWLLVEKVPLLFLSAACSVAQVLSQTGNIESLESVPISSRIANAAVSYVVYLRQFFWPVKLAAFYPYGEGLPAWQVAASVLVLVVVSVAALVAWRRQPALLVGWLWYLGTLVPVIGLVKFARHSGADRYSYLSQIGLCIAVVWGVAGWGERGEREKGRKGEERGKGGCSLSPFSLSPLLPSLHRPLSTVHYFLAAIAAVLLSALMPCAWQQVSYWQNSERLWTRALACTSQNWLAHYSLGTALAGRAPQADHGYTVPARVDAAIDHFRKALEIRPDLVEAHNDLGNSLFGRGQFDEALNHFWTALQIDPDSAESHNNFGLALAGAPGTPGRGQVEEAIAHFRRALEINPDFVEAHNNLGVVLAGRGELDEAIFHFRKVLEIKPDSAAAHDNLGSALAGAPGTPGRGQLDEAIDHFRKALEINPDDVRARNNLAVASRLRQSAPPVGKTP